MTPNFVMDLVTYADGGTYTVEDIDLKDLLPPPRQLAFPI